MQIPGFCAEASVYVARSHYGSYSGGGRGAAAGGTVMLAADSCQCTSPNCSWSCPLPQPGPFCHRGRPNCYADCVARCNDPGGFCEDNCRCCCSGPVPRCYQ